jgi:TetR/AcrR family transcriptional repressor of nem operon
MKTTKKDEILDCAQRLIQTQGYNGFSYSDIAAVVGIRKASIHHYFPTKEDLVVAVIDRYREDFNICLLNINSAKTWRQKIDLYAKLYKQVLDENKLCLCGMLASDVLTLPDKANKSIRCFFKENIEWLMQVLQGMDTDITRGRLYGIAWQIINTLQGGVIMARVLGEPEIFSLSYEEMIGQLESRLGLGST